MKRFTGLLAIAGVVAFSITSSAFASHSWGGYHWARTSNPFTLKVGNNLTTADWVSHFRQTLSDWNKSSVLQVTEVPGQANKRCRPTVGRDEVCDGNYGNNGWLGLASIWLASGSLHITQGTEKMNDTYFNTSTYNNPNEREHVMCQEIGHTFGLDHQSTDGSSLNTCMDYFSNTGANAGSTLSTTPNQHDYDELAIIYQHLDSTTTVGAGAGGPGNSAAEPPAWANPSESVYVDHLPNGETQITYVLWASPIHGWAG
jgi:hypothetical protein